MFFITIIANKNLIVLVALCFTFAALLCQTGVVIIPCSSAKFYPIDQ